jgi:hypothetical protein
MKKSLIILFLLSISGTLMSQKHDYVWVGGEGNNSNNTNNGGFEINFKVSPLQPSYQFHNLDLFWSCAAISDTLGTLKLYTNGCDIAVGGNDAILNNGDNINPGQVHAIQCDGPDGLDYYTSGIQSQLFLPLPDTTDVYYLFHQGIKYTYNPFDVFTEVLYYTCIDMNYFNGHGIAYSKNNQLVRDTLTFGMLTAVKHSNGKDWWVLNQRRKEDEWYVFRFTKEGITDTFTQTIGIDYDIIDEARGQLFFTPDGSKLICTNAIQGISIFDFDRNTGVLSNYQQIQISNISQLADFAGGAVSPNSRYLYVSAIIDLFQYDLWADDIAASQILIDSWDGTADPLPNTFAQAHLGPDCKIYLQTGQQAKALHVIHHPDEAGPACNFEQRGLALPVPNRGSLPYFPHFRLGPLDNPGLPCSPVVSTTAPPTPLPGFSVFPNPASDYLKVVPNRAWSGTARLILVDQLGRTAANWDFDPQHSVHTFDLSGLHAGLYAWQVRCEGVVQQTGKVLVAR